MHVHDAFYYFHKIKITRFFINSVHYEISSSTFAALIVVSFILIALLNQIFVAYTLGKKLLPNSNALALFAGLVVYSVISWIPVIGWMFNALALFVGMGALIQVKKRLYDTLRTKKLI